MKLDTNLLKNLQTQKNLLAFSAGVDSSALFFLLKEHAISFDIAIVNYNLREQSKEEVAYAQELAKTHHKHCFIKEVFLETTNMEASARKVRYAFFEELIQQHGYQNLLTAHQLNDRMEWLFMQFAKGAGFAQLMGMKSIEKRYFYNLVRPLLPFSKEELLGYLHKHKHHYFVDASNLENTYTRNRLRNGFVNTYMQEHLQGIKQSFHFLDEELEEFIPAVKIQHANTLSFFKRFGNKRLDLHYIDKLLKEKGYLCSYSQKKEIWAQKSIILGAKFCVEITHSHIFVFPYEQGVMPKDFKELCRKHKVPQKLRSYLFSLWGSSLFDVVFNCFVDSDVKVRRD